jgi:hypothetical protein
MAAIGQQAARSYLEDADKSEGKTSKPNNPTVDVDIANPFEPEPELSSGMAKSAKLVKGKSTPKYNTTTKGIMPCSSVAKSAKVTTIMQEELEVSTAEMTLCMMEKVVDTMQMFALKMEEVKVVVNQAATNQKPASLKPPSARVVSCSIC